MRIFKWHGRQALKEYQAYCRADGQTFDAEGNGRGDGKSPRARRVESKRLMPACEYMNPIVKDGPNEILHAIYFTGLTPKQVKRMRRLAP